MELRYARLFWSLGRTARINDCWEWQGPRNPKGYGLFSYEGKNHTAHRFAWEMANQQVIPTGMLVCHHCDNPPCINPEHLFLGTQSDNMADSRNKGRPTRVLSSKEIEDVQILLNREILTLEETVQLYRIPVGRLRKLVNGQAKDAA